MNDSTNNPKNGNQWNDSHPSLSSLVCPLRIELTKTTEGWQVDISSLTPGDAMMALAREDMLEESTILCGSGLQQWVACVAGPVELGDAKAILREVDASESPLRADCRMQSVVTSTNVDGISAHVRAYDDALNLAATALSRYVDGLLGHCVSSADLGLVDCLLERTGHITIRPIETVVYPSFVDIGLSTYGTNEPADACAIYDIHSDSWHCD